MSAPEKKDHKHPAMGLIVVSKTHHGGTGKNMGGTFLFGSDLRHRETINLTIMEGSVGRDLSHDWYHTGRTLLSIRMSAAQWATMVSSFGNGNGTPVTLEHVNGIGRIEPYPEPESTFQQFAEEAEREAEKPAEDFQRLSEQIAGLIASGKAGKRDLEALKKHVDNIGFRMRGDAGFVATQHKERMEKTVAEAKIEVEAYVNETLGRLGRRALLEKLSDEQAGGLPFTPPTFELNE